MRLAHIVAACGIALVATRALAWDAHGHRTIAWLAMDVMSRKLPDDAKSGALAFVFAESGRAQVGYQAGEPDRYRAINIGELKHENDPDHYIDIEKLDQFGLTLSTVPPLRYEYLRAMAIAKHEHPDSVEPYNEKRDPARTQEWPGFLPHSIMVHYGKLVASDRQVRVLESLHDSKRADQLAAARANVIFEMGQLAHFVGDAAQPLHTTAHHHGWTGPNPDGFTTANGFHRYIDTTVLGVHHLTYESIKASGCPKVARPIADVMNPWNEVIAHIERSHDQVRPLYTLQKSGELEADAGRELIAGRLCDGGAMLGALYAAAWEASVMRDKDVKDFVNYDEVSKAEPNPMLAKPAEGKPAEPKPEAAPEQKP